MAKTRTGIAGLMMCMLWACGSATDPGLAGANGTNGTNGIGVTTCEDNSECPLSAPICGGDGTCGGCIDSGQCESASGGDFCSEDGPTAGSCVFCLQDTDCTDRNRPLCEPQTGTCRGCIEHDECNSGICDKESAACVDEEDVIYVNGTAPADMSGISECTRNAPCQRLGFAVQNVVAGPRRFVRVEPTEGPYTDGVFLEPGEAVDGPVYIVAEGVTFDWSGNEFGVIEAETDDLIIEGGTYLNAIGDAFNCVGGNLALRSVTIRDSGRAVLATCDALTLVDSRIESTVNDAAVVTSFVDTTIERTVFAGNERGAVRIDAASRLVMRNNILFGNSSVNSDSAIFLISGPGESSATWQITHNTIFDTFSPGVTATSGVVHCGNLDPSLVLVGNIIFGTKGARPTIGCGEGIGEPPGPRITFDNILEMPTGYVPPPGNIPEMPLFVDPANQDFTLRPTSPGVDAADLLNSPPDDINGTARFLGDAPDIGAVESN